jgi:hypothetical protein
MHIPGMRQQGEYYTFLAKKARNFQCPGRVHWSRVAALIVGVQITSC